MFDNIGDKIKSLALFTTVIGIILFVIMGVVLMIVSVPLGIFVIIIGSITAWIGSFTLYGFGELVDSAQRIADNLCKNNDMYGKSIQYSNYASPHNSARSGSEPNASSAYEISDWVCSSCGTSNQARIQTCQVCGVTRGWSEAHSKK